MVKQLKKNIDDLFWKNFIIKEINYEDIGFYFFKNILKAYKKRSFNGK